MDPSKMQGYGQPVEAVVRLGNLDKNEAVKLLIGDVRSRIMKLSQTMATSVGHLTTNYNGWTPTQFLAKRSEILNQLQTLGTLVDDLDLLQQQRTN